VVAHDLNEAHIGELLGKPGEVRVHHLARATGLGGDLDGDQLVSRGRVNGVELILGDAQFHPAVADDPLRGGVASQGSAAAGA